jgi:hypothetical protein
METEELSQKFQVELKWGSYYFIYSIILSACLGNLALAFLQLAFLPLVFYRLLF